MFSSTSIVVNTICRNLLKCLALSFFLMIHYHSVAQNQYTTPNYYVNSKYTRQVFPAEFDIVFKSSDDRKNFKKLREFLWDKDDLYGALFNERQSYYYDDKLIPVYQSKIQQINEVIGTQSDEKKIQINTHLLSVNKYADTSSTQISISVGNLKDIKDNFSSSLKQITDQMFKANMLDSNISNVNEDIRAVHKQIDSALAPEYKQQDFRITISICFTILIAILLVVFFVIVYKRSDNSLSKDLLSGNGLQFVTLFVLIIAVILFGILSILQSSELAAILSGISGYILGKGTQKDLAATLSGGTAPTTAPVLSIVSVFPAESVAAGGIPVRITGAGFVNGATVKIDGTDAMATVIDSTTIIATAPAHAAGTVDIMIVNTDGKSASLASGFKYV